MYSVVVERTEYNKKNLTDNKGLNGSVICNVKNVLNEKCQNTSIFLLISDFWTPLYLSKLNSLSH